jgi:hypothetical protein
VSADDVRTGDTFRMVDAAGQPWGPVYEVSMTQAGSAYLSGKGWKWCSVLADPLKWSRVAAVEQIPAARLAERDALIRRLRDVGALVIQHRGKGYCPDGVPFDGGSEARDPDCEACQALMEADALLGDKVTPCPSS